MSNVQVKDSAQALLTVREVAAVLRQDGSTVYRMVARGTIGGLQFGPRSAVRIPRHELDQLLTGSPIATAGEATASSSRIRGLEVETRVYGTGHILRQSNPIEARIIREWPWPSFFSAERPRTEHRTPTRRRPKRGSLAAST